MSSRKLKTTVSGELLLAVLFLRVIIQICQDRSINGLGGVNLRIDSVIFKKNSGSSGVYHDKNRVGSRSNFLAPSKAQWNWLVSSRITETWSPVIFPVFVLWSNRCCQCGHPFPACDPLHLQQLLIPTPLTRLPRAVGQEDLESSQNSVQTTETSLQNAIHAVVERDISTGQQTQVQPERDDQSISDTLRNPEATENQPQTLAEPMNWTTIDEGFPQARHLQQPHSTVENNGFSLHRRDDASNLIPRLTYLPFQATSTNTVPDQSVVSREHERYPVFSPLDTPRRVRRSSERRILIHSYIGRRRCTHYSCQNADARRS